MSESRDVFVNCRSTLYVWMVGAVPGSRVSHEVDMVRRAHRLVIWPHSPAGLRVDPTYGDPVSWTARAEVGRFHAGAFGPVTGCEDLWPARESAGPPFTPADVLPDRGRTVMQAKRGDEVVALRYLDPDGARVGQGTLGTVFERAGVFGLGLGPLVRWRTGTTCNVYDGDAVVVRATGFDGEDERLGDFSAEPEPTGLPG